MRTRNFSGHGNAASRTQPARAVADDAAGIATPPRADASDPEDQLIPTRELVDLCAELEQAIRDWQHAPAGLHQLAALRLRRVGRDIYDTLRRHQATLRKVR